MTMHVRDGGSWKAVNAPSVRDGGSWKDVKEGWVRDGGTWKQFFSAESVVLTNRSVADVVPSGTTAIAGIIFGSTGQLQTNTGGAVANVSGEWLVPVGNGAAYRVRATLLSGTTPTTNPGLGTWLALSTTREWRNTRTGIGSTESVLRFEIDKGDGVVLATADITLRSDVFQL